MMTFIFLIIFMVALAFRIGLNHGFDIAVAVFVIEVTSFGVGVYWDRIFLKTKRELNKKRRVRK
jgi:hypothetical protein